MKKENQAGAVSVVSAPNKVVKPSRFKRIYFIYGQEFAEGCPMLLQRGSVLLDQASGNYYLQFKWSNCMETMIKSAYLTFNCCDDAGDIIETDGCLSVSYLDVNCKPGECFGAKQLIAMPKISKTFLTQELKIILEDGTVQRFNAEQFKPLPPLTPLGDALLSEFQQEITDAGDLLCIPEKLEGGLARCVCGGLMAGEKNCANCGRSFQESTQSIGPGSLLGRRRQHIEQLAAQEQENLAAQKLKRSILKFKVITAAHGILAISIILGYLSYFSRYGRQDSTFWDFVQVAGCVFWIAVLVRIFLALRHNRLLASESTTVFVLESIELVVRVVWLIRLRTIFGAFAYIPGTHLLAFAAQLVLLVVSPIVLCMRHKELVDQRSMYTRVKKIFRAYPKVLSAGVSASKTVLSASKTVLSKSGEGLSKANATLKKKRDELSETVAAKAAAAKTACDVTCGGCRLCEKSCPTGAITVVDNCVVIDESMCTNCGACVAQCPRKLIKSIAGKVYVASAAPQA